MYSWSVFEADSDELVVVASQSRSPRTLWLAAYTLQAGTAYRVRMTCTLVATGMEAFSEVTVAISRGTLVAAISGGSTRHIRPYAEAPLVLDGSGSFDRDVDQSSAEPSAHLTHVWSCEQVLPVLSSARCGVSYGSGPGEEWWNTTLGTRESQPLTYRTRAPYPSVNTTSIITLTVSDAATGRASSSSVRVVAVSPATPRVALLSSFDDKVNAAASLAVQGRCTHDTTAPLTASWRVEPPLLDPSLVLSPTSVSLESSYSDSGISSDSGRLTPLLLAVNALQQSVVYTFTLRCELNLGAGSATAAAFSESGLSVSVNGPPLPGMFEVTPSEGTELSVEFAFNARSWTDDDLPLLYSFGYLDPSGTASSDGGGGATTLAISTRRPDQTASSLLSAPSAADEDTGNTCINVYPPSSLVLNSH